MRLSDAIPHPDIAASLAFGRDALGDGGPIGEAAFGGEFDGAVDEVERLFGGDTGLEAAATTVAAWIACIGVMPYRTIYLN